MKKLLLLALVAVLAMPAYGAKKQRKTTKKVQTEAQIDTRYRDASLPIDQRVEILLSQMTLNENILSYSIPTGMDITIIKVALGDIMLELLFV